MFKVNIKALLPDWYGQNFLTRCFENKNGMGLTWELINPKILIFYAPLTVESVLGSERQGNMMTIHISSVEQDIL